MREIKSVYCTKCGEFIGNLGNINVCPICGNVFNEEETDQEQVDDE